MRIIFQSPSWVLSAILLVVPAVIISVVILWLIRKAISHLELKKNHEVAAVTFSIIGVLYSVILGFTVVNVQDRYDQMEKTVHAEAILLADLYRDADFFSDAERDAIRTSLHRYVDYVLKEEWWLPPRERMRPKTQEYINTIWQNYHQIEVTSQKTSILYSESISKLNNYLDARLGRLFNSWEHLGSMMWTLLIVGAVIVICFMFFFGLENLRSQMIMTALLTGYLTFMLFLVFSLDNIFTGPQGIKPVDLEQVSALFDCWDKSDLNPCK